MHIGIDFDNTIACYDELFYKVCLESGLIPASLPANKSDVRNYLREQDKEDDWTEIQGLVYGPRITEASPFPGVIDFIRAARERQIPVSIISHKTKHPYRGEKHDLHAAARNFLNHHEIDADSVSLEPTKEAKAERIRSQGCTHFIDDLPEFLELVGFENEGQRILFDPNNLYQESPGWCRHQSWESISKAIL
jgi:hypothetical protein